MLAGPVFTQRRREPTRARSRLNILCEIPEISLQPSLKRSAARRADSEMITEYALTRHRPSGLGQHFVDTACMIRAFSLLTRLTIDRDRPGTGAWNIHVGYLGVTRTQKCAEFLWLLTVPADTDYRVRQMPYPDIAGGPQ